MKQQNNTLTNYTDPNFLTNMPFGEFSHWLQPWRAYLETVPATRFVNGIGINTATPAAKRPRSLSALKKAGFAHVRIEIGWGEVDYATETTLSNLSVITQLLLDIKNAGLRPLILLNANSGWPCPIKGEECYVVTNAVAGSTTLVLEDGLHNAPSSIILSKTGFQIGPEYWAAGTMITQQNGKTLTLSKPLPNDIPAGTSIVLQTLKYRPFSFPYDSTEVAPYKVSSNPIFNNPLDANTPKPPNWTNGDFAATLAGWRKYVKLVAEKAVNILGTTNSSDKGFDIECWNELTFGTRFLMDSQYYISSYYYQGGVIVSDGAVIDGVTEAIIRATAKVMDTNSSLFTGVKLVNGFSNTQPFVNSSTQPTRVNGICKHPYPPISSFSSSDTIVAGDGGRMFIPGRGYPQDRQGNDTTVRPTYTAFLPEYVACAMQTETQVRDMSPLTDNVYGFGHGRNTRPNNPCYVWITEFNIGPNGVGVTTPAAALDLKAKNAVRALCFYLNKGVERLYFFADDQGGVGGDVELNMIKESFLNSQNGDTGPILKVIKNYVDVFKRGLDVNLTTSTKSITVDSISDTHNNYRFTGDGNPDMNSPTGKLYNREILAILPYQVNAKRFVIPYYVMTNDIRTNLAPEKYEVTLSNINKAGARITAYDPLRGVGVPVSVKQVTGQASNKVTLNLIARDYPLLLIVQEA
jgi:hypothetical protein